MFLISFYRILKTAAITLWRNRWLSLAAILVMVLTLFTISFFSSTIVLINRTANTLRAKVDIAVYFNDSASKDQIFAIQKTLSARSDVRSVAYVSKEDAFARWQANNQSNVKIRDLISTDYNPLPRSLEIKTNRTEDLDKINEFLSSPDFAPLIKEISYQQNRDLIGRLLKITTFVSTLGWVLSLLFMLISILIIYNTIRLTIYARSEEIEIMKLVGANDWYVQGPFLLEGMAYGIGASIISTGILYLAFRLVMPAVGNYLGASGTALFNGVSFWLIVIVQLIIGLVLGIGCSVFAVRRHLK